MPPINLEELTPEEATVRIKWTPDKQPGIDRVTNEVDLILREMTCENAIVEYARRIIAATGEHNAELRPVLGKKDAIPKAMECFYDGQAAIIEWLFGLCPENEGKVPELPREATLVDEFDVSNPEAVRVYNHRLARIAWIRKHVSYRMRAKIIEAQDTLNGMSDITGNAGNLLTKAQVEAAADQMVAENAKVVEETGREMAAAAATGKASKAGGKGVGKLTTVR
jgi:hypothetical protein